MWFFMNTCYLSSALTLFLLIVGFFQSFLHFHVFIANHLIFMVLVSMVYFFTETLIIFFFVGTGVSIKEFVQEKKLSVNYSQRSLTIKRKLYPPTMLNLLWMIILFCLVGAVDTHRINPYIYGGFYLFCIVDFIRVKKIQNECFRDNTQVILEMSGTSLTAV